MWGFPYIFYQVNNMNKTYSEEVAAYHKAKRLTTILRLTSYLLVLCCLTLQFPYEFWSVICLIPFFTAYILFLYKPTYFSLCGTGNSSKPIISVSEIVFFSSFLFCSDCFFHQSFILYSFSIRFGNCCRRYRWHSYFSLPYDSQNKHQIFTAYSFFQYVNSV